MVRILVLFHIALVNRQGLRSISYKMCLLRNGVLMIFKDALNFQIINGYPKASRDRLDEANVMQAHDLYLGFLQKMLPNSSFEVIYPADQDFVLPSQNDLKKMDGFIWTGSDQTIYKNTPEVGRQISLAKAIYQAGVPQFGSCWATQIAVVAAGGKARANPNGREWNIAKNIRLTEAGKKHPMYEGKPEVFDGFIMHLDEVSLLPEGAELLASNKHTQVQSVAVKYLNGEFWAPQYHPEFNLHAMAGLIAARKEALTKEGFFGDEEDVLELTQKLFALAAEPNNQKLRQELDIGDDILDDDIRQLEVSNWIKHLVLANKTR